MNIMIRKISPVLLLFVAFGLYAQQDEAYLHKRTVMERMGSAGAGVGNNSAVLGNMATSAPGLIGDVYLDEAYRNTTFMLYDGEKVINGFQARLDLQKNEFDLKVGDGVKALPGAKVKTLLWTDSKTVTQQFMINAKEFHDDEETPYVGFFQLLAEGELTLLKMTELIFKPADRNLAQSVGSKDNQFFKIPKLYYAKNGVTLKLPNRRGTMKLFESRKEEMNKFIEVNELDMSKEPHLITAFNHYNSLVKK